MGKIILTERQYRNLNQILIGKEIENNKGRLNEMTEEEKLEAKSVGLKVQHLLIRCNGGLKSATSCTDEMNTALSALTTKDQFDEASKFTSYWVDSSYTPDRKWATNLGKFLEASGHDNPLPEATKFATYFKKAGGNLTFKKDANIDGLIFKPNSFTLSWPAPAAAPAATNLNWGGSGTDHDKYWNGLFEKLKPYGFKLDAGTPQNGPFMYYGKFIVYKNYSYNNGCTVIDYPTEAYKFTGYDGKYAGQALDKIVLTPCINKGAPIDMKTLLGKKTSGTEEKKVYDKPVVKGGGTGGGGTGGGGTGGGGTGGGGSPFGGQYSDYF